MTTTSAALGRGKRSTAGKSQRYSCNASDEYVVVKQEEESPQKRSQSEQQEDAPLRKSNRSRNKRQKNFDMMAEETADSDSDEATTPEQNKVQKRKRCRAGKRPTLTRKPQANRKFAYTGNIGSTTDAKKELKRKLLLRVQSMGDPYVNMFSESTPRAFPTPPKPISPGAYPMVFNNKENLKHMLNSPLSRSRPKLKKEPSLIGRSRSNSSGSIPWSSVAVEANVGHEMALENLFRSAPVGSGPHKPFDVEMNGDDNDSGLSLQFVEQEQARQELFRSVTLSANEREAAAQNVSLGSDTFFMPPGLDIGAGNGLGIDLLKGITDLFDSTNASMQCSPRFGLADTTNASMQCSPRFGLAASMQCSPRFGLAASMQCSPRFGLASSQSLKSFLDDKMLNINTKDEELFTSMASETLAF